jgi:crotonobetaine/carnitine-CoA ligase
VRVYEKNERTLPFILEDKAKTLGEKVFIYSEDKNVTYGELNEKANRIANILIHRMGIQKGDKVAVMLPNCADYVIVQFGVARTGGVQVPINTEATEDLLTHFLNLSDAGTLLIDNQYLHLFQPIQDQLRHLKKIIVYPKKSGNEESILTKGYEFVSYQDLLNGEKPLPQIVIERSDPVDIFFTSGTTGVSKGVVLPHNHHYHFGAIIVDWAKLGPEDVFYICLPLYHGVTQYMSVMPAMLAEGAIAIVDRFSASRYWDDMRRYRATATWAVYTMPAVLMKQSEMKTDADNPLRAFCTIGIAPNLVKPFEKRFGLNIIDMYGSTEQEAIAFTPYDEKRYGAVGPINKKCFDVRIVDSNDDELPAGETGEIVSRPKESYIQMMEYYNMPEETLKMFRNLWMHSGDLGYIQDDWLYFVGREKDAIRRRGENISSFEVERVIVSNADVKECAAIPIPTELGEDEIKAVIVLNDENTLTPQELLVFCQDKMPKYMVPRYIEIKESLPKTPTEKIEKVKLKEEGVTPNTWDREKGDYIKILTGN